MLARGARLGDRLCVFDIDQHNLGCETVQPGDARLQIDDLGAKSWQPQVLITPATSRTLDLVVGNLPVNLTLKARLFPLKGAATAAVTLSRVGVIYRTTIATPEPVFAGYVQLWIEETVPRREAVTNFALAATRPRPASRPRRASAPPRSRPTAKWCSSATT